MIYLVPSVLYTTWVELSPELYNKIGIHDNYQPVFYADNPGE